MKIKEALNTYAIDGSIFQYLPLYGTATPQQMGIAYVLQHSGKKTASSLVEDFTDDNGHLTSEGIHVIAEILTTLFKDKWDKIYEALTTEYNPLENYNMVEHADDSTTKDYGEKEKSFEHGAQSGTTTKGAQEDTVETDLSAFNSQTYQDKDKQTQNSGSRTDSYSNNSYTDKETEEANQDSETLEHDLTRSGNIGVTTSQQMLEAEIRVRAYNLFAEIFNDIDTYLTLAIYEDDDVTSRKSSVTSDIDVVLTDLANGVKISILKNGELSDEATVYNGITPDFKIENGDLYVNP